MAVFSIWHLILLAIFFAIFLIPAWRIASRAGFSGAWSLLLLVPFLNLLLVWAFAFAPWPALRDRD